MTEGLFITVEGPDGSGKSTVVPEVAKRLLADGFKVMTTREPGGVKIAEEIRAVILNPINTEMDIKTEALLYAAARRQHLIEKILPALKAGMTVLCERFIDSSLAYQGFGRDIGYKEILDLNNFAIDGHFPDFTIYFDVDEKTGLKRIAKGRNNTDRLDQESLTFHSAVLEGYRYINEVFKDRIIKVDATKDIETVIKTTYEIIKERLC